MEATNSPILRYAFVAVFIPASIYDLELGVRVAGIYLVGISLYNWLSGETPVVDMFWRTDHYMTGTRSKVLNAAMILMSAPLIFAPGWVIAALLHLGELADSSCFR